ncbi:hydrogen gas-evolving membrane-bound hydrogenase subunit E, partial [Emergencia timonensis]
MMKGNKKKVAGMMMLVFIVIICWGLIDLLPTIGDPDSAPNTHISKVFIEEGPEQTDAANLVTGVLADYRGFDTFLETTVMYLAGFAVAMVLSNWLRKHWNADIFRATESFGGIDVKVTMPFIILFLLLYAAYVLFHGEV